MLYPTLILIIIVGLHSKHKDVFHCLIKGKVLVSLMRVKVGPVLLDSSLARMLALLAALAPTQAHLELTKSVPSYN